MSDNNPPSARELEDLVLDNDTGARRPEGKVLLLISIVALCWSIFQIWIASPLPYFIGGKISDFVNSIGSDSSFTWFIPILNLIKSVIVLDATKSRYIHLSFAFFLAFACYPAFKRSPKNYIPLIDWILALLAAFSALYLLVNYEALSGRAGLYNNFDVAISLIGIVLLVEATRRALGPPLAIIAAVFLVYTYFGQFFPDVIMHKGHNLTKIASHQWLTTEGVFGIALGVSTSFVFLFVLFGSLLEKAGAGNYFIQVAFSLLGHMKGGPAKAAVLSSGMTGLISGSSIANVVTTGTFTVPLMRKVGFSSEKAGSVEVASSVNGQIMPPVMGAAAFLMVEYIGIPYIEVIKHAFIPAVISYIALLYIVHLEALKFDMPTLPKNESQQRTLNQTLLRSGIIISSIIILSFVAYHFFSFIKSFFGSYSVLVSGLVVICAYLYLLHIKSVNPDIEDSSEKEITKLPEVGPTVRSGLHYILPIAVLVWCLMVERLSPGLSAFWATAFMIFIILTQRPIIAYLRDKAMDNKLIDHVKNGLKEGIQDLYQGLITGAKNMAGIGIATAAAGIVVGAVTQTGVGNKMTELVAIVAGNSVFLMLLFTALICIILGMGLPTTANYIVVSSLMANVIVELGKQNGLIVPLVAVHFFVFYFGIMADVTPPVGLASFAAAAVSGGDPIKTSFQAFIYSIRTMVLPFIFVFNTELLLIGVESKLEMFIIFIKYTFAILIFTAGTQGYFMRRSTISESIMLILVAFAIFRPGFFLDRIQPPYEYLGAESVLGDFKDDNEAKHVRLYVSGYDLYGDEKSFVTDLDFPAGRDEQEIISEYGLSLYKEDGKIIVEDVVFSSDAEKAGFDFDFEISQFAVEKEQSSRFVIYIPALLLLLFVFMSQRQRN